MVVVLVSIVKLRLRSWGDKSMNKFQLGCLIALLFFVGICIGSHWSKIQQDNQCYKLCSENDISTLIIETAKATDKIPYVIVDCSLPNQSKIMQIVHPDISYHDETSQSEYCNRLIAQKG